MYFIHFAAHLLFVKKSKAAKSVWIWAPENLILPVAFTARFLVTRTNLHLRTDENAHKVQCTVIRAVLTAGIYLVCAGIATTAT
jgi:hypothetical protein